MPIAFEILYCKIKEFDAEMSKRFGEIYTFDNTDTPPFFIRRVSYQGGQIAALKLKADSLTFPKLKTPYRVQGQISIPAINETTKDFTQRLFSLLENMDERTYTVNENGETFQNTWKVDTPASGMKNYTVGERYFQLYSWNIRKFDWFQWQAFWKGELANYFREIAINGANQILQGSRYLVADFAAENFIQEQKLLPDLLAPFEATEPIPPRQTKPARVEDKKKKGGGRKPDTLKQIEDKLKPYYLQKGREPNKSDAAIASEMGIDVRTLTDWSTKRDKFKQQEITSN